ncbi:MAG: BatD family protein [Methylococcaceae bacterium]
MTTKQQPFILLFLCAILVFLLPRLGITAEITTSVDRNPINLSDSFQITFTATEEPDGEPDFSALSEDFTLLNQSQSNNSSWTNGQLSSSLQWIVTVMAKQAGTLIIPAIPFGTDSSQILQIQVQKTANTANAPVDDDLFLEVDATPENTYLQSQIIYTLRVYTRININQARLNEPELSDAVIERLGEDSNYNTQINGVAYSVTERKYALFPQKSGALTINPIVLTAEVSAGNHNNPFFNGFFNSQLSKTKRVESKAISLQIKPAPSSFTAPHWLPAENVSLTQQWSANTQALKVGEPLTRTLTLQAQGTTVGQLPDLESLSSDNSLKSYPDQPVINEQKNTSGLTAYREQKIALIPSKPGSYTLPAIEIPWFNTKTQKTELAKIPETIITAIAATSDTSAAPADFNADIEKTAPISQAPTPLPQPLTATHDYFWPGLAAFLGLGWLITLIYVVSKRTQSIASSQKVIRTPTEPSASKRLKKACEDNNTIQAKQALLDWGKDEFAASNLGVVARSCHARLRDEILLLDQALYSKDAPNWTGKKLFQAFTEHQARNHLDKTERSVLKPLYRL